MPKTKICCSSKEKVWRLTKSNWCRQKQVDVTCKTVSCQQKKLMLHEKSISCRQKQDDNAPKKYFVLKIVINFAETALHIISPAMSANLSFAAKEKILFCFIIL